MQTIALKDDTPGKQGLARTRATLFFLERRRQFHRGQINKAITNTYMNHGPGVALDVHVMNVLSFPAFAEGFVWTVR